uniref:Polyketide cyclase n=1 Tax=Streptomyces sp. NBC_00093 TaxID=2975649 RepID=A0AAU2A1C7_9ACTN
MSSIYRSAELDVSADTAWDFIERYTRSEVHVFSLCVAERQEGEYRVVTLADGREIWERNVTVDPVHRRATYTVPGLNGAEHHHAEMRVEVDRHADAHLIWVTDYLPHEIAEERAASYDALFAELVAAVNAHGGGAVAPSC